MKSTLAPNRSTALKTLFGLLLGAQLSAPIASADEPVAPSAAQTAQPTPVVPAASPAVGTPAVAPLPEPTQIPSDQAATPAATAPVAAPAAAPAAPAAPQQVQPTQTMVPPQPPMTGVPGPQPATVMVPGAAGPPPTGTPQAPIDTRSNREKGHFAIAGELGWNTLPGIGPIIAYHPIPELALETGIGLSPAGLKTGLRARWNVLPSDWTPTLGLGLLYATGTGKAAVESDFDGETALIRVEPSPFAQLTAGVNYVGDSFFFTVLGGYAILLRSKNVTLVEGNPDRDAFDLYRSMLGGGIALSVTLGAIF